MGTPLLNPGGRMGGGRVIVGLIVLHRLSPGIYIYFIYK